MNLDKLTAGHHPPSDVNVVIEIPIGSMPVKYELDKDSGALFVDRFLQTAMFYPANYGFIPQTLSGDGDPCDVLVVGPIPVVPGAIIRAKPIGAIMMEDEAGQDEKIIAVPIDKLNPFYADVSSYKDLPAAVTAQIAHFFEHYKDLEQGKWVKIKAWVDRAEAEALIIDGLNRYQAKAAP